MGAPGLHRLHGPEFVKLWAGQSVSLLGSQVSILALPLTAVRVLGASPAEMGVLVALQYLPAILIGLPAGVWVDRLRRRSILVAADVGRGLLLLSIPGAALLGVLRIEQLYLVGFLVGLLTVFFDVAYRAFLPELVPADQLVAANSKLEASRSTAQVVGPGLAGLAVQIATAPLAIVADAASFGVSALTLRGVHETPASRPSAGARRSAWTEMREGMHLVMGDPLLRSMAGFAGTFNFFGQLLAAVYVLYATRELGLSAALLGAIVSAYGLAALAGALGAARLVRRFGLGPTLLGSVLLAASGNATIPLAGGSPTVAVAMLVLAQCLIGLANPLYSISLLSLRQTITPGHLQGRVNACTRFVVWSVAPLGALIGGLLGEAIGLRPTLVVGGVGSVLAAGWILNARELYASTRPAHDRSCAAAQA